MVRAIDTPSPLASGLKDGARVDRDDWPIITEQVMAADILVLCTPIWLGEKCRVHANR